jgi:hypothetical protein
VQQAVSKSTQGMQLDRQSVYDGLTVRTTIRLADSDHEGENE